MADALSKKNKKMYEKLLKQRDGIKKSIIRIKTYILKENDSLSSEELECRLEILESYWKSILSHQMNIEILLPNDVNNEEIRSELEDLYCEVKAKILSLKLSKRNKVLDKPILNPSICRQQSSVPPIKMPQFSLSSFISLYNKLIHEDPERTQTEKFTHLRNCLAGAALRTIDSLEKSAENYNEALNKLKERHDSKYLMFQEHISEMFELQKIQKGSAEQLRNLLDIFSARLSALRILGSDMQIVDSLIINIINQKLDCDSQAKWDESISNEAFPKWCEFENILKKRCQYLEARERSQKGYAEPMVIKAVNLVEIRK